MANCPRRITKDISKKASHRNLADASTRLARIANTIVRALIAIKAAVIPCEVLAMALLSSAQGSDKAPPPDIVQNRQAVGIMGQTKDKITNTKVDVRR
jgi:hypothetical protein